MNIRSKDLPVEVRYHAVYCDDCDAELIQNTNIKNKYSTTPMQFNYMCPKCKGEVILTELEKPQVMYKRKEN